MRKASLCSRWRLLQRSITGLMQKINAPGVSCPNWYFYHTTPTPKAQDKTQKMGAERLSEAKTRMPAARHSHVHATQRGRCIHDISIIWLPNKDLHDTNTSWLANMEREIFHRVPLPDEEFQAINDCWEREKKLSQWRVPDRLSNAQLSALSTYTYKQH